MLPSYCWFAACSGRPGIDQRAIDRDVIARQKPPHLRLRQYRREDLGRDITFQQGRACQVPARGAARPGPWCSFRASSTDMARYLRRLGLLPLKPPAEPPVLPEGGSQLATHASTTSSHLPGQMPRLNGKGTVTKQLDKQEG